MIKLLIGDCRERLRALAAGSVQACITSPPYFSLRDYSLEPLVWGEVDGCEHLWGEELKVACGNAPSNKSTLTTNAGQGPLPGDKFQEERKGIASTGQHCRRCSAWRGSLGLEPEPDCGRSFMELRDDLTDKERDYVVSELEKLGLME